MKKRLRKVLVVEIFFVLLAAMVVITVPNVSGATITVPDDYPTIQGALNVAQPGDTIYVKDGTYKECITISTSDITLEGESKLNTKIDGGGKARDVVTINANDVIIKDFTIQQGDPPDYCGIYSKGTEDNKIFGCEVFDCEIKHNYRGIYLKWTDDFEICNNDIHYNSDCGIMLVNSDNHVIVDNNIYDTVPIDCYASYEKSGISMYYSNLNIIDRNSIYNNDKDGIHIFESDHNEIFDQNTIYDNDRDGIYIYTSSYNKIYNENLIYQNHRDGIHISQSYFTEIYDLNYIKNNNRNGIYMLDSDNNNIGDDAYLANQIFDNNANNNNDGDGIFMDEYCYYNIITNNHIYNTFWYNISEIIGNQQYGVHLFFNYDNIITNCLAPDNIEYNRKDGIFLDKCGIEDTNPIDILSNEIIFNEGNGIRLKDSEEIHIVSGNNIAYNQLDGIHITSSDDNLIEYNTILNNNQNGIYLFDSDANFIQNYNWVDDNSGNGLHLEFSDFNYIIDNSFSNSFTNNQYNGILLDTSIGNYIENNNVGGNQYDGIFLFNSGNLNYANIIAYNTITKTTGPFFANHAIELADSVNTVLVGNIMHNYGVWIMGWSPSHWDSHTISDPFNSPGNPTTWNKINPNTPTNYNPVYYITQAQNDQTFDGQNIQSSEHPGQIILAGCSSVTIQNFKSNPATLAGGSVGILSLTSNNCVIRDNWCYENHDYGMYLFDSDNNQILHNKISNSIYTKGSYGIYLNQNGEAANGGSNGNIIEWNYIYKMQSYGVLIESGCQNNEVFNNIFIQNNGRFTNERNPATDPAQAKDDEISTPNSWFKRYPNNPSNVGTRDPGNQDFPNCGNYWSDWSDIGSGSGPYYDDYYGSNQDQSGNDGIVDLGPAKPPSGPGLNPYPIDGFAGANDDYPFIGYGDGSPAEPLEWTWP